MFGIIIKNARETAGLSQDEAAERIRKKYGVRLTASYLSMIENGTKTNMTVNLIKAMIDFFSLPVESTYNLFATKKVLPDSVDEENGIYSSTQELHEKILTLPPSGRHVICTVLDYIYQQELSSKYRNRLD